MSACITAFSGFESDILIVAPGWTHYHYDSSIEKAALQAIDILE